MRRTSRGTRAGRPGTAPAATRPGPTVPRPGPPAPGAQRVLEYTPHLDGDADPGEVVWGWVAYEEDPTQGKDRPVLVVGRGGADAGGGTVLGLMLSSQEHHDREPGWLPLGSGPWDAEGRPSWVRLDRVLELPGHGIRREGAVLDRARFDRVAAALRADHGWS
ncbi:MAG TPA: type II toxin-antitoxin system PemK/MazF family toxin [Actinomycetes bacterium]|nr:type II toxin-antitoxin system PemK/MazF family toxin [Actinomycetes bacterium]